ncbi:hypothetical protein [Rhizobium sp. LjRoot254]|uniref:hypothetical protein n=1 Tax=Rhizobium sp. LjRoot254 TaxID=3342297 RepID=UPI003ECCF9E8
MFIARHEKVSHSIALPISADEAIEFFTPEGERMWVDGWAPRYFFPANGETIEGMVFATGEGDELTYWTVVDFDLAGCRARYCRVTPGSRSTIVEVTCVADGEQACHVDVSYTLTGLSEAGNTAIGAFVGDAYIVMIEGWRTKILEHLERMPHRVSMY